MLRPTLVLAALSGCDFVLGLEPVPVIEAACGPYSKVRPVPIVGVSEPRLFSIAPDEQTALVMGTLDGEMSVRPIPLRFNGDAWEPHPDLQGGLTASLRGARIAPNEEVPPNYTGPMLPAMNAWLENSGTDQLSRYYFSGSGWTADVNQTGISEPDFDIHAGNVILVRASPQPFDRVRHTVVSKISTIDPFRNQILLYANSPPTFTLVPKTDRTRPLNEEAVAGEIALGDAALTQDQATLVYAAVSGGQSNIYATAQSSLRDFDAGGLIADIATADDELEPSIDATCSKLYFRRVPQGTPNDPGQILVAE